MKFSKTHFQSQKSKASPNKIIFKIGQNAVATGQQSSNIDNVTSVCRVKTTGWHAH